MFNNFLGQNLLFWVIEQIAMVIYTISTPHIIEYQKY